MPGEKAGGRKPRVTESEILEVFHQATDPVLSTAEVAEALPIKRRGTLNRLEQLREAGELESKAIGGRNTVWWSADRPDASGAEDVRDARDASADGPDATGRTADPSTATSGRSRALSGSGPDDTPEDGRTPGVNARDGALEGVEFPDGRDRDECEAAVLAARDHLREHGPASMRELVAAVMPAHPVGYDAADAVEKVDAGERYRGAWWRHVVKPGLEALEDVKKPSGGQPWRAT